MTTVNRTWEFFLDGQLVTTVTDSTDYSTCTSVYYGFLPTALYTKYIADEGKFGSITVVLDTYHVKYSDGSKSYYTMSKDYVYSVPISHCYVESSVTIDTQISFPSSITFKIYAFSGSAIDIKREWVKNKLKRWLSGANKTTGKTYTNLYDAVDKLIDNYNVLTTKTITENGTYKPSDDGYDGYSRVTVEVPGMDTTHATATVFDILEGETACVNEETITGIIPTYDGGFRIALVDDILFSFTLAGTSLQAEEGMTWAEWIESDYNTINLSCSYGNQCHSDKLNNGYVFSIKDGNGAGVSDTDTIIADTAYTVSSICCFDAGTQILMADNTTKSIEDVEVGDMVMSYNLHNESFESRKVLNTIIKGHSDDLVECTLSDGKSVRMRAYHPLLTTSGWKSLREYQGMPLLEIGDEVITIDGVATLIGVEPITIDNDNYLTYNLNVEGHEDNLEGCDNYIANGIVAHNAPAAC